ncbi:MAG: sialidase family protein [Pseudomonadota bacterium]
MFRSSLSSTSPTPARLPFYARLSSAVAMALLLGCGLSACGGGDDTPDTATATAPLTTASAPNATSTDAERLQALAGLQFPSWPDTAKFVYHDEAPELPFSGEQLQVASNGNVFMTWHATHKTAQGQIDGTDINVTQYDAATKVWSATTVVANVPFPDAGGGYVYNLKAVPLPDGDMGVFWDVVDRPAYDFFAFNKPPELRFSRYSAASRQWSAPQSIPGTYAIYRADDGWWIAPAGDGRILLVWQSDTSQHARFYSTRDGTWSEPQDVGTLTGRPFRPNAFRSAVFFDFNRSGSGIVTGYWPETREGEAPVSLYFDAARQAWRAVTVSPAPAERYRYGGKSYAVDEQGNVWSALQDQTSYREVATGVAGTRLVLSKWSAQTGQIVSNPYVYALDTFAKDVSLNLTAQGGFVTWADTHRESTGNQVLRYVSFAPDGSLTSHLLGPELDMRGTPQSSLVDLRTRMGADGTAYFAWSVSSYNGREALIEHRFSVLDPVSRQWSAPSVILPARPLLADRSGLHFQLNPAGMGALVLLDQTRNFVNGAPQSELDVRVIAME